jgi:hypothetical protein
VDNKSNEAAVCANFVLMQIAAKRSKPFTDGEFEKECIMKATEILWPEKQQLLKTISLFANTVADLVNNLRGTYRVSLKKSVKK